MKQSFPLPSSRRGFRSGSSLWKWVKGRQGDGRGDDQHASRGNPRVEIIKGLASPIEKRREETEGEKESAYATGLFTSYGMEERWLWQK